MRTIEYLMSPDNAPLYWPIVFAGLAIAVTCATLSVMVVLKRLVFIGQGVSHAAFGGVGIAYALGVTGVGSLTQELSLTGIVVAFCVVAALTIAAFARDERTDSIIGIILVGAMALGFILLDVASRDAARAGRVSPPSIESVLFGSFAGASLHSAIVAIIVAAIVLTVSWLTHRKTRFWAFDESGAEAFGLATGRIAAIQMTLLALAIVTTMRLAGVILATALLVLPGAIALRLSRRWLPVLILSQAAGVVGVVLGLVLCFEMDMQPGPTIVGVLLAMLLLAIAAHALRSRNARHDAPTIAQQRETP